MRTHIWHSEVELAFIHIKIMHTQYASSVEKELATKININQPSAHVSKKHITSEVPFRE